MNAALRWAPWWALVVVPSMFLGSLSAAYAVAPLACREQARALMHVAPVATLVATLVGLALSAWTLRRLRGEAATPPVVTRRFLGGVGLALGVLFLFATLLQWYVAAALSPCFQ
jgi:heme/copper-type cytochrome/quinol oxidase subunit 3